MKEDVQIVWLKRDLRLTDHEPLLQAATNGKPTLIIYIWEPSLLAAEDYSARHWQFVAESLDDMSNQLAEHNLEVLQFSAEAVGVFEYLDNKFVINRILSHQETGLRITYERDKAVQQFCSAREIVWEEFQQFGVKRGRSNRNAWAQEWYKFMEKSIQAYTT